MNYIDLRSDTVTKPTTKMRDAMYNAAVALDEVMFALTKGLCAPLEGLDVNLDNIHTSILTASVKRLPISIDEFLNKLKENKIKVKRISDDSFRMVTHLGIGEKEIKRVVKVFKETINNI